MPTNKLIGSGNFRLRLNFDANALCFIRLDVVRAIELINSIAR